MQQSLRLNGNVCMYEFLYDTQLSINPNSHLGNICSLKHMVILCAIIEYCW